MDVKSPQSNQPLKLAHLTELTTNTVAQCVRQQNSSVHATINDSREFMGFHSWEINENRKNNLQEYFQWERARYRHTE